jgi:hypothetical protein
MRPRNCFCWPLAVKAAGRRNRGRSFSETSMPGRRRAATRSRPCPGRRDSCRLRGAACRGRRGRRGRRRRP